MTEARPKPDLDAELDALMSSKVVCKYAQMVPEDVKAAIRRRVESGKKGEANAWTAFASLCQAHGADVSLDAVAAHFKRGHSDDR